MLSDPSYMIKFLIPNSNAAGNRNNGGATISPEESRLSFKFKKLLNDDDEQLGMYRDHLMFINRLL